jgi:hypothetical protein
MNLADKLFWDGLDSFLFELGLVLVWLNRGHVLCCVERYVLIFWNRSLDVLEIEFCQQLVLGRDQALVEPDVHGLIQNIWLFLH